MLLKSNCFPTNVYAVLVVVNNRVVGVSAVTVQVKVPSITGTEFSYVRVVNQVPDDPAVTASGSGT